MDTWRLSGDCLDSKLMADLKIERRSASVGTGKVDAAQLADFPQAGGPAEAEKAAGAEAPAQVVRREGGTRRGGLTVFVGGRLAFHVAATRGAVTSARVGRLRLVTVEGKRVHQPASA